MMHDALLSYAVFAYGLLFCHARLRGNDARRHDIQPRIHH